MSDGSKYLYDNRHPGAKGRLRGLEDIEDGNTISLLESLIDYQGRVCLEIGAGAGSIAEWLSRQVGLSGSVTATDIEPKHLLGSNFEVIRHDIEKDDLPADRYDLVHMRHVLIHLANPLMALKKVHRSMKRGAVILVEESDLASVKPQGDTLQELLKVFQKGVDAIFKTYESRGIEKRMGAMLASLLREAGFVVRSQSEHKRSLTGASPEAVYQSESAKQLATSIDRDSECIGPIKEFADCLLDPKLKYQSRTTVSVLAGTLV